MKFLQVCLKTTLLLIALQTAWLSPPAYSQTFDEVLAAAKRGDYPTAFRGFSKLAEQGDAKAQFALGVMYEDGRGVPKDEQQAVFWFRKAAEQGDASAQSSLGFRYAQGQGVPKDEQQAIFWSRKAAEQGDADAQYHLGVMYRNGRGVPKDEQQAVFWYRRAAERGDASAQNNLGLMYAQGQGVPKDEQQAYFWWLLASAKGNSNAVKNRDRVEKILTPEQRASAQAAARDWKPGTAISSTDAGVNPDSKNSAISNNGPDATGSGMRISRGLAITNNHVIAGCQRLALNGRVARVQASDARSDLALLSSTGDGPAVSLRGQRVGVGEAVSVTGYPLRGLLSGFNLTTGNISSLSGVGGDTRYLQITAPVQPGNSGGPMLDSAGNLAGVVVSKLDAIQTAKITGDIPQNVNFAINVNVLRAFLDANNVDYATAGAAAAVPTTVVAERARAFTVLIECWK